MKNTILILAVIAGICYSCTGKKQDSLGHEDIHSSELYTLPGLEHGII